jgi:hypothetical protein
MSNIIIVAGSGRSGTTWLGNIIAGDEYRIIFEPFDYRHVPEAEGLGLRPYFRPDEDYPRWHPFMEKALSGAICNEWVDQDRGRLNPARDSGKILVKDIRVNGLLGWIDKNFHCRIVYIVRNPFAVIASRLKLKWETHVEAFLDQPELMKDYLAPYEGIMRLAETKAQKHAVMWCVENLVPLRQMKTHNWILCRYEGLLTGGEEEIKSILTRLGLDLSEARKDALSETVRPGWTEKIAQHDREQWKSFLTARDKEEISSIVQAFGIDFGIDLYPSS